LAALLTDGGERVGIPTLMEPKARHNAPTVMMETIARSFSSLEGLPNRKSRLTRHSEMVLFSDFLEPEATLAQLFGAFAVQGVRGHLVQILDPAEESLPYRGRVEFIDSENGARFLAERAESLRADYQKKLAAHKAAIALHAASMGWTPFLHHTDHPAVEALLPLHMHLSGLEKAYRAKGLIKGQTVQGNGLS